MVVAPTWHYHLSTSHSCSRSHPQSPAVFLLEPVFHSVSSSPLVTLVSFLVFVAHYLTTPPTTTKCYHGPSTLELLEEALDSVQSAAPPTLCLLLLLGIGFFLFPLLRGSFRSQPFRSIRWHLTLGLFPNSIPLLEAPPTLRPCLSV